MNTTALNRAHTAWLLAASPCFAEEVLETWTSDEDAMRVKFDRCGDAPCGNVVWVKPASGGCLHDQSVAEQHGAPWRNRTSLLAITLA